MKKGVSKIMKASLIVFIISLVTTIAVDVRIGALLFWIGCGILIIALIEAMIRGIKNKHKKHVRAVKRRDKEMFSSESQKKSSR